MHLLRKQLPLSSRRLRLLRAASRVLSLTLAALLVWPPAVSAQSPAAAGDLIELRIVSGAGAEFQPGSKQKQRLAIQVVNQDEHPIAGVAVTFRLPDEGASGLFADGQRSVVAYTNDDGEASIAGIQWNNTPGGVSIRVTAVKGTAHAGTLLPVALSSASTHSASTIAGSAPPAAAQRPDTAAAPLPSPQPPAAPASAASSSVPAAAAPAAASLPPNASNTRSAASGAKAPMVTIDTQPGTLRPSGSDTASGASRPASDRPEVSISGASQKGGGSSSKKWLLIAVIAGGAAAGAGMALLKSSSGTSAGGGANPLSIGSPTVSVGHP